MSSDQIFQEFKLYIEGVQVPFINMSINQSMGNLPQATITIPPQAGLMDIARFYQPKVNIFFTERDTGIEKVLFTGLIIASSYSKTKDGGGNIGINFTCNHRYSLITECLVDYCGAIRDGGTNIGGTTPGATMADIMNSSIAIQEALTGWTDIGTGVFPLEDYSDNTPVGPVQEGLSRTDVLPSYLSTFSNRLIGMPGVFINYWNQLKRAAYNPNTTMYQGSFKMLYQPLIEDGLGFFKRLTGHMIIEESLNADRAEGCGPKGNKNMLIPPSNQIFLKTAVQANMAVANLRQFMQNSNDVTNIYSIFQTFYQTMEYDIITLASPAEVLINPKQKQLYADGLTYAVDTIVKPSLPFYFSPACNVLYPSMYTSISINYDEMSMPTRLNVLNLKDGGFAGSYGTHFRTPASIRSAIAAKNTPGDENLAHTTGPSYGAIGRYEMGRGIKYEPTSMPNWLSSLFTSAKINEKEGPTQGTTPVDTTKDDKYIKDIREGWNVRYPGQEDMNPWDPSSNIPPHQRVLFSTADYYFTKKFASTKAGNINCLFNPYIIPGYAMDVLEASPNLPSFHGLCVAVTHNISATSVSTQVSLAAAMTYTELANYYVPFINPYLSVVLGVAANPTLVNNDENALSLANDFYTPTLGVTAVAPETLFNFSTGGAQSVKMSKGIVVTDGARPLSSHSYEDDLLTLCQRPIESKKDYADRFGLRFIDMIPQNYSATGVKYKDPKLSNGNPRKFEIGQSQFLTYSREVFYAINGIKDPLEIPSDP